MTPNRQKSRVRLGVALLSFLPFTVLLLGLLAEPGFLVRGQSQSRRQVPTPSPAAAVTRSTAPLHEVPATIAELQARIQEVVRQPALEHGFFAVKIVSLDTGQLIYEQSSNKFVRPASNMKLYTVAAALDRLTPDYRFLTSIYAKEKPDKGTVKGDLIIFGRGDPSFAARFNDGDYFKGINALADRIVAAGVKRVKGDLVGPVGAPLEFDSGREFVRVQYFLIRARVEIPDTDGRAKAWFPFDEAVEAVTFAETRRLLREARGFIDRL